MLNRGIMTLNKELIVMKWFRKRQETVSGVQAHDFTQLVSHARDNDAHYQKIRVAFSGLTKPYQQPIHKK